MNWQVESGFKIELLQDMAVDTTTTQAIAKSNTVQSSIPKQPYESPRVTCITMSDIILNNSSGGGDGDAALAHS